MVWIFGLLECWDSAQVCLAIIPHVPESLHAEVNI